MRIHKKIWFTVLLLCIYLASCIPSVSNNTTAMATNEAKVPSREPNAQVAKVSIKKLNEWRYSDQYVDNVRWTPTSDKFAVSFFDEVKMLDVKTFQEMWSVPSTAPAYNASAPVFGPDGQLLYLYVRLKGLQVYDSQTGELLTEAPPDRQSLCFLNDADGTMLSSYRHTLFASVEDNRKKQVDFMEIQRWDVSSLHCDVISRIEGHPRSIDISSDGKYLSASTGKGTYVSSDSLSEQGEIVIWDIETKEEVCTIKNKGAFAHFKPLESRLLVADPSLDKLSYWDIATCSVNQEIEEVTTYYDFAFSPDGKMIALWDGGSISILDADSGALLQKINDPSLENMPLNHLQSYLAFSPDGRHLLTMLNRDPLESVIILWSIEK